MSLFSKKEKETACSCSCKGNCGEIGKENSGENSCCGEKVNGICCIKVLGSGCKNCHALFENAKAAVTEMGLNVEVEYITDMQKIMEYGAMSMPVLVINEKIAAMGKVLNKAEIIDLLNRYKTIKL